MSSLAVIGRLASIRRTGGAGGRAHGDGGSTPISSTRRSQAAAGWAEASCFSWVVAGFDRRTLCARVSLEAVAGSFRLSRRRVFLSERGTRGRRLAGGGSRPPGRLPVLSPKPSGKPPPARQQEPQP
jgi:hypothetical protein